jgi:hypothetical protein
VFGTSPELWLNLQNDFDVQTTKRKIGEELDKIDPMITVGIGSGGDDLHRALGSISARAANSRRLPASPAAAWQ